MVSLLLFVGARAGHQDIDESSGALLPVGIRRDVRDADEGAQEIDRIEIFPEIATFDRALPYAQRFSLGTGEAKTLRIPLTLLEDTWRNPPGKWRFLPHLFDWLGRTEFARTGEWAPTPRS